ncbi:MAG TPA: hypothetical protein VGI83_05040 [Gemmatimonadales bacterium]|jgi:hypothetical protein
MCDPQQQPVHQRPRGKQTNAERGATVTEEVDAIDARRDEGGPNDKEKLLWYQHEPPRSPAFADGTLFVFQGLVAF